MPVTIMIYALSFFSIGVLLAFWGSPLRAMFRFLPGLWAGAQIGISTGLTIALFVSGSTEPNPVIGILLLLFVCLLSACLGIVSAKSEKKGVFCEFFAYGYNIWIALAGNIAVMTLAQGEQTQSRGWVVLIVCLLIAGVIGTGLGALAARFYSRIWSIAASSLLGGVALLFAFDPFTMLGSDLLTIIILVSAAALIIAGFCVQLKITGTADRLKEVTQVSLPRMQAAAAEPASVPAEPAAPVAATVPAAPVAPACVHCGMPLKPGIKFCPECGQRQEEKSEEKEETAE